MSNVRHRKKRKYNTLREQMEFYFSDANLRRDRFMKDLYDRFKGEIPLREFLIFNCIKKITTCIDDIIKAIEKSNELICNKYRKTVKRTNDKIEIKEDIDDYMIYVESIPSTVDIKWLQRTFLTFGKIDHISLPRFKKTNQIKEFAFIEFHNKISVSKAIKYFKTFDGIIDCDNENIQNLYSIKTYGDDEGHTLDTLHVHREKVKKIKNINSVVATFSAVGSKCKKICYGIDVKDDNKNLINIEGKNDEIMVKEEIKQDDNSTLEDKEEIKNENKNINEVNDKGNDDDNYESGDYCCDGENCDHGEDDDYDDDDEGEEEEEEEGVEYDEEYDDEECEEEEEDDDDDDMTDDDDEEDVAIAEADEADLIGEANVADDVSSSNISRYPNNDDAGHNYNIAKYDNIKDVSNLFNTIRSKNFDSSIETLKNINTNDKKGSTSKNASTLNYVDEKKRLRRKRKLKKVKKVSVASIHDLKIMTKKEWKRLRNVYLNLQRELRNSATVRKPTLTQYSQMHNNVSRMTQFYKPHLPLLLPPPLPLSSQSQIISQKPKHFYKPLLLPPPPPLTSRTSPYSENKIINDFIKPMSPLVGFSKSAGYSPVNTNQSNELTDVKFEPNVILYLQLNEPCTNIKEFKETLRKKNKETIRYIDIKEGDSHAYVRLTDSKYVCDVLQSLDLPCKLLSGNDELEYWLKINKDRKDKIMKNVRVKKEKKPYVKIIKTDTNIISTNSINCNSLNNNNNNNNKQRNNNRRNRRQMKIQKNKHIYFND